MPTMQDNEFDEVFRTRFSSFEMEPSEPVWGRIVAGLDNGGKHRRVFPVRWVAAAGIILAMGAGFWLLRPAKTIRLYAVQQPKVTEAPEIPVTQQTAEKTVVKESLGERISALKIAGKKHIASYKAHVEAIAEEKIAEIPLVPVVGDPAFKGTDQTGTVSQHAPSDTSFVAPGLDLHSAEVPVLASADGGGGSKSGIRSVGDLLNYVVGKVDHRKDKLIEFVHDEDDGTMISGINLGLIRIKTKPGKEKLN